MKVPIVIFFFKRKHALKVIRSISQYKPTKLYLVSDGGIDEEEHLSCLSIRELVEKEINWNCEIIKKYYETNQGVDVIIPRSITEIFEHEDILVILEDDCVASLSFYKFCEILLEKYKDNNEVMCINGVNWFDKNNFSEKSYFYSIHPDTTGWATWKKSWLHYDNEIKAFEHEKENKIVKNRIKSIFLHNRYYKLFKYHYRTVKNGDWKNSHWDGKWLYALFVNKGVSIVPHKNLVSNIGFDDSATHTTDQTHFMANKKRYEIDFPLNDNDAFKPNEEYDILYANIIIGLGYVNFFKSFLIRIFKLFHIYKPTRKIYRKVRGRK